MAFATQFHGRGDAAKKHLRLRCESGTMELFKSANFATCLASTLDWMHSIYSILNKELWSVCVPSPM